MLGYENKVLQMIWTQLEIIASERDDEDLGMTWPQAWNVDQSRIWRAMNDFTRSCILGHKRRNMHGYENEDLRMIDQKLEPIDLNMILDPF